MGISNIKLNSKVTLKNGESVVTYEIVSPDQVNPLARKISVNSPLVKELLKNKEKGKIAVQTPRGVVEYEILEIEE